MQNLSKNTNLVVQKSDKGNSVIILDKDVYINILNHFFVIKVNLEKTDTKKGLLNFTVKHEERINEYVKSLNLSGAVKL